MNRDRPVLHGDDHTPGGPDPIKTGVRHLVGETGEPAFQNSWANAGGTDDVLQFWLVAGSYRSGQTLNDKRASLEIVGSVTGGTYGTVVFTLPDGYRPANTLYLAGSDNSNNPITWKVESTGDVSVYAGGIPAGSVTGTELEDSGVTAGTYGDATHVAQVTVDAKGRVTSASDVAITGGSGDVATDTIWAAKGDLAVGTGADTAAVETVGANNTVLVADSAQTNGLKWAQVGEAMILLADVTTDNVTSSAHGFAPKSPADATKFLNGATTPAYAQVKDSDLSTSDITTNDVSTSKHGFAPKAPSDATKYLDGTGAWSVPSGGGGGGGSVMRCKAYRATTDQTILTGTNTVLLFNAEEYDTNAIHDNTTNTSRFVVPTGGAGVWLLNATVMWSSSSTNDRYLWASINGSSDRVAVDHRPGKGETEATLAAIVELADADYVEFVVFQNSGVSLTIQHIGSTKDARRAWGAIVRLGS